MRFRKRLASIMAMAFLCAGSVVCASPAGAADRDTDGVTGLVTPGQLHLPAGMELVTSGAVPPPPPAPRTADGVQAQGSWIGPYTYRNFNSGKCLDILGASKDVGAMAVQYTCVAGGQSQMWWVWYDDFADGIEWFHLGNAWSGLCLDAWTTSVNNPVRTQKCYSNWSMQMWHHNQNYPNRYSNIGSGHFLEVQAAQLVNNAAVITWYGTGNPQQVWLKYAA